MEWTCDQDGRLQDHETNCFTVALPALNETMIVKA